PPPPPAGPVPIPYPNSLQASDLTDGSKTVKIQDAETALEDASNVSTSTGDEGGTQGGNVVTHKTKGKGYFMLWSFDVMIEGKGVDRHGDPMGQNCASSPPGATDIMAIVAVAVQQAWNPTDPCTERYDSKKHRKGITAAQRRAVKSGPCWQCGSATTTAKAFTPDHQPPIIIRWYAGGCHMSEEDWKKDLQDAKQVYPHCKNCSG